MLNNFKHTLTFGENMAECELLGILLRGCHGVFILQILRITLPSYNYLPFKILESGFVAQTYNPSTQGWGKRTVHQRVASAPCEVSVLKTQNKCPYLLFIFCYYLNENLATISFNLLFLLLLTKYWTVSKTEKLF